MKKLLILLVVAMPATASAQSKPVKGAARDVCAPIGKTADGQLVYGLACNMMPAPPPRAAMEQAPAAAAEPEVERSGIFGMSYTRKPGQ